MLLLLVVDIITRSFYWILNMAKPGGLTHMFVELSSLDELSTLLGKSARLKYTCVSASRKYLVLGSNSGGAYIFSRDTLKYLQVVFGDTEASLVVAVSLSPSDQHVALALSTGHVAVYELNIDRRAKPDRVRNTQDHAGCTVTALTWDTASSRVFVGDNTGKISIISVPTNKSKTLFTSPSEVIAYVESYVYQMEWLKDKLLVSTLTHTHLFDTTKQNYSTIGTKSRDGEFGACFFVEPSYKYTVIYCARPGSRMWEVDIEGKVMNTHQFKQLLAVPPVPIVNLGSETFDFRGIPQAGQTVNFCRMFHISQFIITWSPKGLYLLDPINVKVMLWTQSYKGIKDICMYNNDVYLFLEDSSLHRLTLLPIYQLFTVMCSKQLWSLSSSILISADQLGMRQAVVKRIKRDLFQNIIAGLQSQGKNELLERVLASMDDLSEGSIESGEGHEDFMDSAEVKGHTYLPSGMVVVSEGIQIKRAWEKTDLRMKILENLTTSGTSEASATYGMNNADKEDTESHRDLGQMNNSTINEVNIEDKQKDNNLSEQTENNKIFINQEMTDESKQLLLPEVVNKHDLNYSDNLNSNNKSFIQSQFMNDKTASLNNEIKLKGSNLLTMSSESAQNIKTQHPAEIDTQNDDIFHECTNGHGLDKNADGHSFSVDEISLVLNVHTVNSDDDKLSSKHDVTSSPSGSTDLQFPDDIFNDSDEFSELNEGALEKLVPFDDVEVQYISQYSAGLAQVSGDMSPDNSVIVQAVSHSSIFYSMDADHSEPSVDEPYFTLPTEQDASSNDVVSPSHQSIYGNLNQKTSVISQEAGKTIPVQGASSTNNANSEMELLAAPSVQELTKDVIDYGIVHESSKTIDQTNSERGASESRSDDTINKMAALDTEDITKVGVSQPNKKSPVQKFPNSGNSSIAQSLKVSKKKRKTKLDNTKRFMSIDVNTEIVSKAGTLKASFSVGDEHDDQFSQGTDIEMDSISIATISSIEEESSSMATPDSLSATGDFDPRYQPEMRALSPQLSLSPPEVMEKLSSRKLSVSSSYEEKKEEVIPPLLERLAAARGSLSIDDISMGHQSSRSNSPVSGMGDHFHPGSSPRTSLSALKDGLSMKLKTQTKSLIKTFKEKGLLTKSSSTSMLATLSSQQLEKPLKDGIIDKADDDVADEMSSLDELSRIQKLAAAAVDTKSLFIFAQDIQEKLNKSSGILKPAVLQRCLNEWAVELSSTLLLYHEELLKRRNGNLLEEKPSNISKSELFNNNKEEDSSLIPDHKHMNNKVLIAEHGSAISNAHFNVASSNNSTLVPLESKADNAESASSKSTSSARENLTPDYWSSVIHCHDPFQLPSKQLGLIRDLTTMCFVCSAFGGVLNCFNFTEEIHYRTLVRAVLPASLCTLFDSSCECVKSMHPNLQASSETGPFLDHSIRNIHTKSTEKFGHVSSTVALDRNNTENSRTATMNNHQDHNPVSQELIKDNNIIFSRTHISHNSQDERVDKSVSEKNAQNCSCKHASLCWSDNEGFRRDLSMALFIRLLFFALDYERVKQALDCQTSKVFVAWTSLVLCSREIGKGDIVSSILANKQINSAIDYLRSGILPQQSAQLGHIYNLFEMAPAKTSEFCGEIHKTITPVDLLQLSCLCSKPASAFLLRYCKQAMVNLPTVMRPTVFRQLIKHRDVRFLLLEALLQPESSTSEVVKSLVIHLKSVLPFNWLEDFLALITTEEERDRTVQLCAKAGCPAIFIKLLTDVDQWQKLLRLIVQLDDIRLLNERHGENSYIPKNEQEWRFLLKCFQDKWSAQNLTIDSHMDIHKDAWRPSKTQDSHDLDITHPAQDTKDSRSRTLDHMSATEVLNDEVAGSETSKAEDFSVFYESFSSEPRQDNSSQGNSITWNSLGYLLLRHVGGATTIDLLMEHLQDPVVAKNCLTAEFLKACYIDFSIRMEQNHVTHDILEKMSVYMWTKKPDYLPPSVFQAIRAERRLTQSREGEDVAVQRVFSQVKALESRQLMSEHLGSQWGQEVYISSNCGCCNLPLESIMSLSVQGVITFPCGHTFHRCCVSGFMCPMIH